MTRTAATPAKLVAAAAAVFGGVALVSVLMQHQFGNGFLPHGYCFTWIPALLWLNVSSDVLIALAYLSIPLTLVQFARRRDDLPFSWVFLLFGVFIIACGATHALDVWTVWNPDYWLAGGLKALTAAASVPTAIALVWLMPKALAIPSAAALRASNEALQLEVEARKRAEQRLEESRDELSRLAAQRGQDLHKTAAILDAFFDSAPLGLAVFDNRLRYVRVNARWAGANDLPVENHWGRSFDEAGAALGGPPAVAALKALRDGQCELLRLDAATPEHGERPACRWRLTLFRIPKTSADQLIGLLAEELPD